MRGGGRRNGEGERTGRTRAERRMAVNFLFRTALLLSWRLRMNGLDVRRLNPYCDQWTTVWSSVCSYMWSFLHSEPAKTV